MEEEENDKIKEIFLNFKNLEQVFSDELKKML